MERWIRKEDLVRLFLVGAGVYVVKELAFSAASRSTRKVVKERANGICETCKRPIQPEYAVVAHRNHDQTDEHYNDPDYLAHDCLLCETVFHLTHFHNSKAIGLSKEKNANAAYSAIGKLTKEDYTWLLEHHSKLVAQLIRYLHPDP